MITYWPSPAKLNLFLYITGQRSDGYHYLQTLFQFLDYGDLIAIKPRWDGQLNLLTPIAGITYENNIVIRAARLLIKEASKINSLTKGSGADIYIKKRLPIGGGLGGGSSNAATILIALNHLWWCCLNEDQLLKLGFKLGADVPIFIHGYAAFAEGIGEIFTPVKLQEKWYLVVYPLGVNISTSLIFKNPELPRNLPKRSLETLLKCEFSNVCEIVVRKHFYQVDTALTWLLKYAPSRLTGTGSCIFAEFDTKNEAYQVLKYAPKWLCGFVARSLNLSPLREVCSLRDRIISNNILFQIMK